MELAQLRQALTGLLGILPQQLLIQVNLNGTPLLYSSVLLVGEFCAALRQ